MPSSIASNHENLQAYRACILHFLDTTHDINQPEYEYFEDGLLIIKQGKVLELGDYNLLLTIYSDLDITDYSGHLIMPGFIDTHIHFPQVEVIASYGEQLLDWLNNYTFPCENQFSDKKHATYIASFFLDELLKNGTTTALVYGSVHKQACDAFFEQSSLRNTRMICGKVMMDRNAPDYLCDTAQSSFDDSQTLIKQWHGNGRQLYAITPRFAITSTEDQLKKAGQLKTLYPDCYMQTHISENIDEVAFVKSLFPEAIDYVDVYDQYGLLGKKSVFAHGIHLTDRELHRLNETNSSVSFCPTSNLFLGSGLLDIDRLQQANVNFSVATDVGGGTSFSMLNTLSEAYKIAQIQQQKLSALKSLYLATLGNAKSLQLEDKIGWFNKGNEADFIVLDFNSTDLMKIKTQYCKTFSEKLFSLIIFRG